MAAIRFSVGLVLLALASCRSEPAAPDVPPYAVAAACEQRRFEGSAFTLCRYDRHRHRIAFFLDGRQGRLRSLTALEASLGPRAESLRFAMNAGMYDERGGPIGLYVAEGRERHAINRRRGGGNFHLLPNGVFQVAQNGRVSVVRSAEYDPDRRPLWATQSGPMLVIDGALHPAIRPNGDSLHVRNGVGVADENIAWFAISDEPVSFGRLARLFRDQLGCRNALYLDGSVSSLWDRPAGRRDSYSGLGPLVAVFARERQEEE
ncbi:MAG TPA: phosphodiester glycosidase family protein [Allosphingosinicella sp.]|nr:phosphodiester glycosidase family protein [Allosphingosinicella sp.]